MPITKSAIKKLRVDKRRAVVNAPIRSKVKSSLKIAKVEGDKSSVSKAYSALDTAVKKKLLTSRGVARLKSRLVKMLKLKGKVNPFA
jgi:ribosomal protein S20